ncbi:hypothetical protein F3Y22_tig00110930pilonHSYRG00084 [Hibiscus syriacus]|uniref:Uncharacterized protein n=1 Tax=Hibiscus syriacus TaxID=106335 RepID=A0A6A2ZD73_HIBSY|nr:hypothetical protein F3Y22_tig00110930pilonHSYRG00084 [Hibiscus syriacus]
MSNLHQRDEKEGGPTFYCHLCDAEVVYNTARAFLPGLATACVDNTTGDIFKSPASVAAEIRKEMVEYLMQRSETFVAESVVLDDGLEIEVSGHPYDIIAHLINEFASTKRNLFSRVSGWHSQGSICKVLRKRVEQLRQKYSTKLANIGDVRSLTYKVKDLDAKLGPLKVGTTNKVDEAAKTIENVEFLEASDTNKVTENGIIEAAKAEIMDSKAKLQSLEVASLNKDNEEDLKTKAIDTEAKLQSLVYTTTNKDTEEALKTAANHYEARPPSLEVTPENC